MESVLEEWRPVAGKFSGWRYEVSNLGRVRSVAMKRQEKDAHGGITLHNRPSLTMSFRCSSNGYPHVALSNMGRVFNALVHRLVAEAFIPNPQNLLIVNHIDGNKKNPRMDNLEWVSASGNLRHAEATGLRSSNGRHCRAKLTDQQAVAAYEMRSKGMPLKAVAKMFGVDPGVVGNITAGRSFKRLGLNPLHKD